MNVSIPGEAASTARDALVFYIYRAEMDCGLHAGTPEGDEAERRLEEGKNAIRSLPDSSEVPASVSFSGEVAATVTSALIAFIVQAEMDVKSYGRWTKERGVAKKRQAQGESALHRLTWAISKSKGGQ